ncbi:MAG TPA: hypothetical protein VM115_02905, partial [Vicinamibacterales bacterium]|nr:hypothetical protein [Vicinamibacterales bacterium]
MTSHWVIAHLLSLIHGLAAALISIAAFYVVGLLFPRKWQSAMRWLDSVFVGVALYLVLCWIATSSRHIPVIYVILIFAAGIWALVAVRFRWLQATVGSPHKNSELQRWLIEFCSLYLFAYALVRPYAGAALLTLPPDGALDLVTYARYAKHVLTFGTANVDLATFAYVQSPGSTYLLAWHSLLYLGDPLDAAMPLLFMLAALFGSLVIEFVRSVLGLSWRAPLTIAVIALCAPLFRWTLATYSLGALLSATAVLYLAGVVGRMIAARAVPVPLVPACAAGCALLVLTAGPTRSIAGGVVDVARHFSPIALIGLPTGAPRAARPPDAMSSAALVILPLVPLVWAAAVAALRRSPSIGRIGDSAVDRQLVKALAVYIAVGVIIGNIAVQAVSGRVPVRWPGAWRGLAQIGRMPFQAFTLKVADQPNGLSTALAMYYLPGRKADVIGRGVATNRLPFEHVTRQQPMFIQNFGCEGVGHADAVSAPGVGCLLMAPPSMTVGTSYPFNRTFLFLHFDRMSARDPGGRWNAGPTLNLRLTADPQRAPLNRDLYLNFLVNPFLPAGVKPQ